MTITLKEKEAMEKVQSDTCMWKNTKVRDQCDDSNQVVNVMH